MNKGERTVPPAGGRMLEPDPWQGVAVDPVALSKVKSLLAQILPVQLAQIGDNTDLSRQVAVDSILRVTVAAAVWQHFGVRLSNTAAATWTTPRQLAAAVLTRG